MFEYLAVNHPQDLLRLVDSKLLTPPTLTFAAEISGRIADSQGVRLVLVPLLDHPHALVREGAIYGLLEHVDPDVLGELTTLAERDPSPGVRQAATNTLDEL